MHSNKLTNATKRRGSPLLLGVPIVMMIFSVFTPAANAASPNQQIKNLQNQNAHAIAQKQQLSAQAATLSDAIAGLQAEIVTLESQINQTKSKVDELNRDIAKAEADLARQRELLGINLRQMYTEYDISTLEMLASSRNFSHFVDRDQYRQDVQEKIDDTKKKITKLMDHLAEEKKSVEQLLSDQQSMQGHLNERRAENARLLGLNQEQQQAFQNSLNANNAQITALQRQQVAANKRGVVKPSPQMTRAAAPASNNGGRAYPWANAPFPNSLPDTWGMYKRQCVSYTAWKVASSGRHMPYWGGRGNANKWDENARGAGIPVDSRPRVGDVAISNAGAYGHAMYVEAVHGDGTITISQYNADWRGNYSEARRRAAGLAFIHF